MRFREIRVKEINEVEKRKREEEERQNQAYLKIKPQTNITVEEAKDFWNAVFSGEES